MAGGVNKLLKTDRLQSVLLNDQVNMISLIDFYFYLNKCFLNINLSSL